jgi:hypothetical protein
MKRQMFAWALWACIAASGLVLSSCSTISSRIDSHRSAFDSLSAQDRALVSEGKIRGGMSPEAVYIAWGQPQQKATGIVHGNSTETWVYTLSTAAYGPNWYGGYGYGYYGRVGYYGRHGPYRYYGAFYDPLWDPFYYPFPATVSYPVKTVSFQNGRVVAFQYLTPSSY